MNEAEGAKADHPLALTLLHGDRPARLKIVCPPREHPLAAVYDLPPNQLLTDRYGLPAAAGLVICQPGMPTQLSHIELGDLEHGPEEHGRFHADVFPLHSDRIGNWIARCHCHTWTYRRTDIEAGLRHPHGHTKTGVPFIYGNFSTSRRDTHR
jgi:hypothetical protein